MMRGFITGIVALALTGCKVPKDVAYFQDVDSSVILQTAQNAPITVKPGDKLSIIVKSKDPQLSALFNLPVYSSRVGQGGSTNGTGAELRTYTGGQSESVASYTVSPSGEIDFPVLGDIKVSGMTRSELSGYIKGELMGRELVKDPTVIVDFLSTGISIIGEVNKPGRYDLNRDNINIIEALALAGDLTVDGQRKNVKVVRIEDGNVNTYVLDLTDAASDRKSVV